MDRKISAQGVAGGLIRQTGQMQEVKTVHQREFAAPVAGGVPHLPERYWGQHLWGRGYFCSTVDEQTVREYIEGQKWGEEAEGFRMVEAESS